MSTRVLKQLKKSKNTKKYTNSYRQVPLYRLLSGVHCCLISFRLKLLSIRSFMTAAAEQEYLTYAKNAKTISRLCGATG